MLLTDRNRSLKAIANDLQGQSEFCKAQKTAYRTDIDGLRAVAVLSVLGFHYFGPLFPGGYVGVDIFYVISGYLLSGIIISELEEGKFSFRRFYERRIRRIFPALFALLFVSTIFSAFALLTVDFRSYLHSAFAAAWSTSNIYFWRTSNYFDAPSADRPLLHTWSLAVEEQFYLVFPVFMFVANRYLKRHLKIVVIVAAIASFVLSVWQVRSNEASAFYLPFGRTWELLLGTIVFLRVFPSFQMRAFREFAAFAGLLMIAASVFRFNLTTPFPGEYALLPCIGAAALIAAGQQGPTGTNQFLSLRPFVFMGLISYSLYLWNWPLLVFSRIAVLPGLSLSPVGGRFLLTLIAFALAALSWRFVESPFRAGAHRPRRRAVYIFALACEGAMSLFILVENSSFSSRIHWLPKDADSVGSYIDYPATHPAEFNALFQPGSCFLERREPVSDFKQDMCLSSDAGKRQVLIFGDSEAANLRFGLQTAFPAIHFLQATSSACPPILVQKLPTTPECKQFVAEVVNELIRKYQISTVLLSAAWFEADMENLAVTILSLQQQGVRVIVFGPLPEYRSALPRLLAESIVDGKVDYARDQRAVSMDEIDRRMEQTANDKWHVRYVSTSRLLCESGNCIEYASPGVPLEFDYAHLTLPGSVVLGRKVFAVSPDLFSGQQE